MKVSTSLNVFNSIDKPYTELIKMGLDAGFECFDFNGCDYIKKPDSFYNKENWREEIKKIKDYADSLGVEFYQAHAYISPKGTDDSAQIKKSIEAAALAGAKWTVIHPYEVKGTMEEKINKNIELIKPYAEFASRYNIGLAVENEPKQMFWYDEIITCDFYLAEYLIPIVDSLNGEFGNVGVCWDTGHANLAMKSQYDDLLKLGKRLKVMHIADNSCQTDDHLPPFLGYTDFKAIMKALYEIGYEGTFNFETHNFCNKMPEELVIDAVAFMKKIGDYIVNMPIDG